MSTYNICFRREIRKIICGYPLLSVAMYIVIIMSHILHSVVYLCVHCYYLYDKPCHKCSVSYTRTSS